jgi:uncharacterized protein (DUF58 family)
MNLSRLRQFFRWFYRYRSIRLTPDGVRFVLLTLAVGVAAINTGNNLLYLLLAMMLSLIVMSGILSEQCFRHLQVRRILPEHLFANRPTAAAFSLANRKRRFPSFSLRVLDLIADVPVDRGVHLLHLPPGGTTIQPYSLLITRRGPFRFDGIKLLTRFPFGLFLKAATLPLPSELLVYPELTPLPAGLVQELTALGQDQAVPRRGPGVGLYNVRGYQAGDDSRAIHWKTSARQAELIVRETEAEDQRRVVLALPTSVPETGWARFEEAASLVASLADFFRTRDYAIGLVLGTSALPTRQGSAHFHEILRALCLCQPTAPSDSAPVPEGFRRLGERTLAGELTLLILPAEDSRLPAACGPVSRVLRLSDGSP